MTIGGVSNGWNIFIFNTPKWQQKQEINTLQQTITCVQTTIDWNIDDVTRTWVGDLSTLKLFFWTYLTWMVNELLFEMALALPVKKIILFFFCRINCSKVWTLQLPRITRYTWNYWSKSSTLYSLTCGTELFFSPKPPFVTVTAVSASRVPFFHVSY